MDFLTEKFIEERVYFKRENSNNSDPGNFSLSVSYNLVVIYI